MTKFDEAINIVKSFEEDFDLENWLPTDKAREIINGLRAEYAPTVEMTKTDKERLLYDLENYSFYAFIETVHRSKSGVFGIPGNNDFNNLSDEDLMQAWLHPETIKVAEEEK